MVERKKDEKLGPESGMKETSEPDLSKASGGSNLGQANRPGTSSETDKDKQFGQKGSESGATGRRGETTSEKDWQSKDSPGLKKDVNKDWQSSGQSTGSSSTGEMSKDESSSSDKDVEEKKKSSEKEEQKRKSQY